MFPDEALPEDHRYLQNFELRRHLILRSIKKLRYKKKYQKDKQELRRVISIPSKGFGARKAQKWIAPYINAYVDCAIKKRGSYKKQKE